MRQPGKSQFYVERKVSSNSLDHKDKDIADFEERRRQSKLMHDKSMQSFKSQIMMLKKSVIREEPNYWHAGSGDEASVMGDT